MDVLNKADMLNCFYHEGETRATVEIRCLEQGYEEEITFRKSEIVFIIEGELRFLFRDHDERKLREGEFVFLPARGEFRYTIVKKTRAVIFRLNGSVKLCDGYRIEELYVQSGEQQKYTRREVYPLEVNYPLRLFLKGLSEAVSGGLSCRNYFDIKTKELFVLLKVYYSHEALRSFFSLILSPDTAFSEYVRANHYKYKTAKELAEAMNITPKLFSKKFMRIFGEPAQEWMIREKAHRIYSDLHTGDEPIALVADKFWFSSQSHLNKFCKREFGKTPGEIRRESKG